MGSGYLMARDTANQRVRKRQAAEILRLGAVTEGLIVRPFRPARRFVA